LADLDAVPDIDEVEGRPVDDDEDGEGEDLFGEAMEECVSFISGVSSLREQEEIDEVVLAITPRTRGSIDTLSKTSMMRKTLSKWMQLLEGLLNRLWRDGTAPPEGVVADALRLAKECRLSSVMV
jgi:hypothetical protein